MIIKCGFDETGIIRCSIYTTIVELPVFAGMVAGYGCIVYWMCAMEPDASHFLFFKFLLVVFMVVNVGFSLCQSMLRLCCLYD
jgi:hypothetical protein